MGVQWLMRTLRRYSSLGCGSSHPWNWNCWWGDDKVDSEEHCYSYQEISSFHHLPGSADHRLHSGTMCLSSQITNIYSAALLPMTENEWQIGINVDVILNLSCSYYDDIRFLKVKGVSQRIADCLVNLILLEFLQLQGYSFLVPFV